MFDVKTPTYSRRGNIADRLHKSTGCIYQKNHITHTNTLLARHHSRQKAAPQIWAAPSHIPTNHVPIHSSRILTHSRQDIIGGHTKYRTKPHTHEPIHSSRILTHSRRDVTVGHTRYCTKPHTHEPIHSSCTLTHTMRDITVGHTDRAKPQTHARTHLSRSYTTHFRRDITVGHTTYRESTRCSSA